MVELVNELRKSGVAVVGAGGSGDVISAYVFCEVLRDLFGIERCLPAAILWERWFLDPYPGPIPKSLVRNAEAGKCVYVGPDTYVERCGGKYVFRPHAAVVAEVYGEHIPAITLEYGVYGIIECLHELMSSGFRYIVALDVGGDILASGYEETLWSPLADSLTLAAVSEFNSLVAVLAPGADGELPQDYVMERVSEVMSRGGYIGALGLWKEHTRLYEEILPKARTEAGRVPYEALIGHLGVRSIREGTRRVQITPLSSLIFMLRTDAVIQLNKLAQELRSTGSLAEALKTAEELGVPTELHLEIEIAKRYGCGPESLKANINTLEVREAVRERVAFKRAKLKRSNS
ncbi:MAG: hypothetical protein DRO14_03725 [Thermoprotei archaeon]|nr:MAG: hypothetical protein DRO14_03725 [Thermoprotei archaeon]